MTKAIKDRLVGVWELVEAKFETSDGSVIEPYGPSPLGLGIITENGYLSAQIMRAERTKFAGNMPTQEEKQKAYDDYLSYYGHFSIDEEKGIMTTLVEGATNANWVGDKQVLYYEFKGDFANTSVKACWAGTGWNPCMEAMSVTVRLQADFYSF
jgi:hypothetical protein